MLKSFIGQGYYGTHTPGVILRNILENPAWYTAYTPYQPEISQGRLEALVNFQTMVCDLTGMAIANASMLDEATAAAEAMTLCQRVGRSTQPAFLRRRRRASADARRRAHARGAARHRGRRRARRRRGRRRTRSRVLLQYPGADGDVRDYRALADAVHARGGLVVVAADLLALTLLAPPGEWGADVVVGSTQRFGVPMGYGGPHAGFLATRDEFKRSLPGRLVGVTVDADGGPAYRLALQTREQHIRREKATSNICTAQVLLAVIASMYAVYHGPQGLTTHRAARAPADRDPARRASSGSASRCRPRRSSTRSPSRPARARARSSQRGVAARHELPPRRRAHARACRSTRRRRATTSSASGASSHGDDVPFTVDDLDAGVADALPPALARTSAFLTHPVFNRYHSETEMLRYLRRLADRDLALDRSMIPLGSCTMKLNATTEMIPVTWPEFGATASVRAARTRPRAIASSIAELERMLCAATGYAAVSLQPNAGSQGEYAGLLADPTPITRAAAKAHRNVCLIPASAHGTNPASAQMAGMQVVVVACDADGNVDLADLEAKAHAARARSRRDHGHLSVDARRVRGGHQAHLRDRARARRPGVRRRRQPECAGRPRRARASSAPTSRTSTCTRPSAFRTAAAARASARSASARISRRSCRAIATMPRDGNARTRSAPVSAAPFGSASILPISWMYITMMGGEGLTAATRERDPRRELHREAPRAALSGAVLGAAAGSSRTNASSTCGR